MQHVYALLFSGVITTIIAIIILYSNYGFWRDTYIRSDTGVATGNGDTNIITESPKDVIGSFLEEASVRLRAISADKKEFFEGTEVYR